MVNPNTSAISAAEAALMFNSCAIILLCCYETIFFPFLIKTVHVGTAMKLQGHLYMKTLAGTVNYHWALFVNSSYFSSVFFFFFFFFIYYNYSCEALQLCHRATVTLSQSPLYMRMLLALSKLCRASTRVWPGSVTVVAKITNLSTQHFGTGY